MLTYALTLLVFPNMSGMQASASGVALLALCVFAYGLAVFKQKAGSIFLFSIAAAWVFALSFLSIGLLVKIFGAIPNYWASNTYSVAPLEVVVAVLILAVLLIILRKFYKPLAQLGRIFSSNAIYIIVFLFYNVFFFAIFGISVFAFVMGPLSSTNAYGPYLSTISGIAVLLALLTAAIVYAKARVASSSVKM